MRSIKSRLTLGGGIVTIIAMATVTLSGSYFMYRSSHDAAEREMRTLLDRYANDVSLRIVEGSAVAATVANAVAGNVATGSPDRRAVEAMMKVVIASNPNIVGLSVGMEPGAFDGKDGESGRFIPYAFRKPDGAPSIETLGMTAADGAGEWYDKPVRQNRPRVLDPYAYTVDGKSVLMTTAVGVVHDKAGAAIGMAGVDMGLSQLQAFAGSLAPLGVGQIMIAAGGSWVAHPDTGLLGKPIDQPEIAKLVEASDRVDGPVVELGKGKDGARDFVSAVPVRFPGIAERWHLIMTIPQDAALAGARAALNMMIATSALILVLVLVTVFVAAGS
ncbi:hypothetical protein QR78_26235, partial [Methylobacterium indicum]